MTRPDDSVTDEVLLQRFLQEEISEEDADELLHRLQASPELARLADGQRDLHFLIGLFRQIDRFLTGNRNEKRKETVSQGVPTVAEFFARKQSLQADRDALARQVAEAAAASIRSTAPSPRKNPATARAKRTSIPLLISVVSLLVFFGTLIVYEWNPWSEPPVNHARQYGRTPAIVISMDEVRWHAGIQAPRLGEPLPPGTLSFESGSIELLTFKGVRSVVEGPAELVLLNDDQVFCKRGRWSVTVPKQGHGFEIQTPTLTLRDLGTEFYTDIDPEKCDLHVLRGSVELERPSGTKTLFRTGEGSRFRREHPPEPIAAEPKHFVTRDEMRRRSDAFFTRGGVLNAASRTSLKTGAIRAVDFNRESVADAMLLGGEIVEGSTPRSKAFRLAYSKDRIRLKPAGSLNSMTAVVSLRIDRLGSEMNPILMSDGTDKNGLVWHVLPKGAMIVGVRTASGLHGGGILETPIVVTDDRLGQWMCLAFVVDGPARRLTVYADGDPIFSQTTTQPARPNLNRVHIGCWQPSSREDETLRRLDGAIEQVLIFDRALDLNEIRTIHQP